MAVKAIKTVLVILTLALAAPAWAADEKIDPETYICAELVASSVDGEPPLFAGLQMDGFAAAKKKQTLADADILPTMVMTVYDVCSAKPAEKVLGHWQRLREAMPVASEGHWDAEKATCADYKKNPDDASGFIIWLDGYNRGKTGTKASIFTDQATLDHFLEVCAANPQKRILDVLAENAK